MNHFCIQPFQFLGCLLGVLIAASVGTGQEPLELLRKYPPSLLQQGFTEDALASIEWQLKQQAAVQSRYQASRDEIASSLEKYDAELDQLNRSLPPAIRFLNGEGRSATANRAMEQLLQAKLELVSRQAIATQLHQKMEQDKSNATNRLQAFELEKLAQAARSRVELAASDYEEAKKLRSSGSVSNRSIVRAQLSLEIAQAEYEIAAKKAELVPATVSAEVAKQLTDARIGIQPIEAKIEMLKEFLNNLYTASETIEKIKRLERERNLWQKDLAMVAQALFKSTQESIELQTFQSVVEQERKKAGGDKALQPKKSDLPPTKEADDGDDD